MPGERSDEQWGRVPVRCFGRWWYLRDVPAIDWIMATGSDDMAGVFPGLVDDGDGDALFRAVLALPDMQQRCINVSRRALERGSGREWHWTLNFVNEVKKSWPYLNGKLVREGVRADRTRFPDWIDAAYTLLLELTSEKDREPLDRRLRKVPAGMAGAVTRPRMSTRAELLAFAKD